MFKHIHSGKFYKRFGLVKHKDAVTREWVDHILYAEHIMETGKVAPLLYSRTKEDWENNFENQEDIFIV